MLLSLYFSSCWCIIKCFWVFKSDWDAFFSTSNKGQAPSACEQVNIAAKADCGLKLSS
jgi:hypothetical protein